MFDSLVLGSVLLICLIILSSEFFSSGWLKKFDHQRTSRGIFITQLYINMLINTLNVVIYLFILSYYVMLTI